jgi:hypothetical protein
MLALETNDRASVVQYMQQFRYRGTIAFETVLSVPRSERIPALIQEKNGTMRVAAVLTASINSAISNLNLRVGLNEDQVVEIAAMVIEASHEDNLALEDVLLFLQQLVRGEAGKIYDRLDIPTFFELFETYRESRHQKLVSVRYEEAQQFKTFGPQDRASEDTVSEKQLHREALGEHLKHIYEKQEPNAGK